MKQIRESEVQPPSPYAEWIEAYVTAQPDRFVRGKCAAATKAMAEVFPELRRTCGFVAAPWGDDQHWWCVAPDGTVVDPTAEQFPYVGGYEEVDLANPHRRIPTGRCMHCAADVFYGDTFCSLECSQDTEEYLRTGILR